MTRTEIMLKNRYVLCKINDFFLIISLWIYSYTYAHAHSSTHMHTYLCIFISQPIQSDSLSPQQNSDFPQDVLDMRSHWVVLYHIDP